MKNFTKKFFMLSAAMLLSVGAFAQGDGIAHRYPEFTFTSSVKMPDDTYETLTFTMPAWDAYVSTEEPAGTGKGYRMQLIENPVDKNTPARVKIVAPRAFSHENTVATGDRWFASFDSKADIIVTKPDGTPLPTNTVDVTYGDIFGSDTPEPTAHPFTFTKTTSTNHDLTIQYIRKIQGGKWLNYHFKIVEIGEAAFRNAGPSGPNVSSIDGTVTIPKTIEKIEDNAFRHGIFNKVVFEEGSQITTIEKATFEGCPNLVEVNIPASVTKIEGTAFGSCKNLNKIVFEGNLPTLTKEDEEPSQPSVANYKGPYNFYQGATRLQHSAASVGDNLTPSKCIIEVPLGKVKDFAASDKVSFKDFALSSKITLGDKGKMTYCSEEDFTVMQYNTVSEGWEEGALKAYYVKDTPTDVDIESGKVNLTQITGESKIPGWSETDDFGVFFRGEANKSYSIFYPYDKMSDKLTMSGTKNCLKGVIKKTMIEIPEEDYLFFIFSKSTGTFRQVTTNGNCQPNKAYIKYKDGGNPTIGTVEESKELAISFPEETGITSHEMKSVQNDAWYTLQGIQVKQPQKGVFIKNGKKYIVK